MNVRLGLIVVTSESRFEQVVDSFSKHVYAYCRRRADPGMARDAASETFLIAWRRIDDVPHGEAALPWLYGVARRVLANQFRSEKRRRRLIDKLLLSPPEPPPGPEAQVVRRAEEQDVLDALGRLRPADQELLRLAVWEELPHGDIGQILSCSAHAVDQRISRATHRLKRELKRSGHIHEWTGDSRSRTGELL